MRLFNSLPLLARLLLAQLLLIFVISPLQAGTSFSATSHSQQSALLELYTSEGCSSCPPADRWLSQIVKDKELELNVLALAFHVDYWDYIGWKDPFASPKYTTRQRELASANNMRTIYTPGFFINGQEARNTRGMIAKLQSDNQDPVDLTLQLNVTVESDRFNVQLTTPVEHKTAHQLQFVVFEDELESQVSRGENSGHTLKHEHVVRYLSPLLDFTSEARHVIAFAPGWKTGNQGVAAIVKSSEGRYLQSVQIKLNKSEPVHN